MDEPLEPGTPSDPAGPDVPAEDSPVPAGPATVPSWGVRPWQGPDRLVLRVPLYHYLIFPAVFFLFVLIYGGARLLAGERPAALALDPLVHMFVVATLFSLWVFPKVVLPRVTFDKAEGLLTLGWKGRRGRRPLASVVGVQVKQTRQQFGDPESNIPPGLKPGTTAPSGLTQPGLRIAQGHSATGFARRRRPGTMRQKPRDREGTHA
jgi:hypothetical protein